MAHVSNNLDSPASLLLTVQERIHEALKQYAHISVSSRSLKSPPFDGLLHQRKEIVQSVPNFWLTVLLAHPAFTFLITSTETQILRFCTDIDVRPNSTTSHSDDFDIVFSFAPNPYLPDDALTLTKRYTHSDKTGRVVDVASPVQLNVPESEADETDFDEHMGLLEWLTHDTYDSAHLGELIRDQIILYAIELYFGTYSPEEEQADNNFY